jgi:hypothetical protein
MRNPARELYRRGHREGAGCGLLASPPRSGEGGGGCQISALIVKDEGKLLAIVTQTQMTIAAG